jgi:biopolymer transport protein ExbD
MGDIAFLLTIFFLLCSNFAKEANLKFTPPRSPDVETIKETGLTVVVDVNGDIYFNGRPMPNADALQGAIEASLHGKTDPAAKNVLFKCDQNVDRTVFEPVLEAISQGGGVIVAVGEKIKIP